MIAVIRVLEVSMKRNKAWWMLALACSWAAVAADLHLRVEETNQVLSVDPFDPAWAKIQGIAVPLMAQRIAPPGGGGAVASITMKAMQHKEGIAVWVSWKDATKNENPSRADQFADAVALQFPLQPGTMPSPFMGDQDLAVAIWRWSASAQKDFDEGYQHATATLPRLVADDYAHEDQVAFRAGEGAGNIVSLRRRLSPVEHAAAKGFGSLTSLSDQPIQGKGAWKDGVWYVVFHRSVTGTPTLWRGTTLPIAVAVWDGAGRERNGMKSVSVWQTLDLPGAPAPVVQAPEREGRRVYDRYGCGTCHGKEATVGAANPNAQFDPIPPLNKVKAAFTRDEIMAVILKGREPTRKDPAGPPPPFKMNEWESIMTKEEAGKVIDYLFSLQPKEEW